MELVQVGEKTYYIKNGTNIGIYQIDSENVYLIDTGNDKEAGKKILKIVEEKGWKVKGIINTHSNADHIGGNKIIQERTACKILAHRIERAFIEDTILEPSFLYGGYPFLDLQNKFLLAKSTKTLEVEENLPEGLEYVELKGHFFDMIGVKTSDNIYFIADALFSEETILKYHVFFLYDVESFLGTLDRLETLKGELYIPSHIAATEDITMLIQSNRKKVYEIIDLILKFCDRTRTFEEILAYLFNTYHLVMNANQYVLIGSTLRSYLSYLYNQKKINYQFQENKMLWKQRD
ncbi:MAG: MBL fold metallo-hydrolase [Bacilli bacterium]|nr:MBL fold metallo-hydrolase [Bacilli bacterium]